MEDLPAELRVRSDDQTDDTANGLRALTEWARLPKSDKAALPGAYNTPVELLFSDGTPIGKENPMEVGAEWYRKKDTYVQNPNADPVMVEWFSDCCSSAAHPILSLQRDVTGQHI